MAKACRDCFRIKRSTAKTAGIADIHDIKEALAARVAPLKAAFDERNQEERPASANFAECTEKTQRTSELLTEADDVARAIRKARRLPG